MTYDNNVICNEDFLSVLVSVDTPITIGNNNNTGIKSEEVSINQPIRMNLYTGQLRMLMNLKTH